MKTRKQTEKSCGDLSLDSLNKDKSKLLAAPEYNANSEHPTPEQLLFREGLKYLTPKQRVIWEYWNYDRLTQDEIAEKLRISQPVVAKHIRAIEKRLTKYGHDNKELIKALREAMNHDNGQC